jgi:hypothetical protein
MEPAHLTYEKANPKIALRCKLAAAELQPVGRRVAMYGATEEPSCEIGSKDSMKR